MEPLTINGSGEAYGGEEEAGAGLHDIGLTLAEAWSALSRKDA